MDVETFWLSDITFFPVPCHPPLALFISFLSTMVRLWFEIMCYVSAVQPKVKHLGPIHLFLHCP